MILITAENTTTAHINELSKTTDSSLIRYMLLGKLYTCVIIIESKMNRVGAYYKLCGSYYDFSCSFSAYLRVQLVVRSSLQKEEA